MSKKSKKMKVTTDDYCKFFDKLIKERAQERCEVCQAENLTKDYATKQIIKLVVASKSDEVTNMGELNFIVVCQNCLTRLKRIRKVEKNEHIEKIQMYDLFKQLIDIQE